MARHEKPSKLQSWLSYIGIFGFVMLLGTVGTIVQIGGGRIPGLIEPHNPPPAIAGPMAVGPPILPGNNVSSNFPGETLQGVDALSVNKPIPTPAPTTTTVAPPPVKAQPPTTKKPTPKPTPTPTPQVQAQAKVSGGSASVSASMSNTFDLIAHCESTDNWSINTGNGFYGGLQITLSTWAAFGGLQYASRPDLATESEQKAIAVKIQAGQGWGAWPACAAKLGLL